MNAQIQIALNPPDAVITIGHDAYELRAQPDGCYHFKDDIANDITFQGRAFAALCPAILDLLSILPACDADGRINPDQLSPAMLHNVTVGALHTVGRAKMNGQQLDASALRWVERVCEKTPPGGVFKISFHTNVGHVFTTVEFAGHPARILAEILDDAIDRIARAQVANFLLHPAEQPGRHRVERLHSCSGTDVEHVEPLIAGGEKSGSSASADCRQLGLRGFLRHVRALGARVFTPGNQATKQGGGGTKDFAVSHALEPAKPVNQVKEVA